MTFANIPEQYTHTKATLEKAFNRLRQNGTLTYGVSNPNTPRELRELLTTSNILIVENPVDGSVEGTITTVKGKEKHPKRLSLSGSELNGMTNTIFLDIENGIDEKDVKLATARDVAAFIEKTYKLQVCGVRKSSSGKAGKWHAWVLLDDYLVVDKVKEYISKCTPDQRYKLFGDKNGRPIRRLLNPWLDVSVYSRARLSYSVSNRKWAYTAEVVNKASSITRALTRLKPAQIPNDYSEEDFNAAKTAHRLSLGMDETEYNHNYNNDLIDKDEVIYTKDGEEVKAGSLGKERGRYSFVKDERSPSLQYNGDGQFYDHRHQQHYTITDNTVITYDKYISEAYDFSKMTNGVIHAITGAGKTYSFERPLCLIAVPRRSQATMKDGESSLTLYEALKEGCVFITHDKLLGHIKNTVQFLYTLKEMGVVLVIDEAHLLHKDKKKAALFYTDAVFLSGTLSKHFRHDLEHLTFIPKIKPVIWLADAIEDKPVNTLYFADNITRIKQLAPNAGVLCAEKHDIPAPAILTKDSFATSAYREGITLKTDGTFRAVVLSKYCQLWSVYDKVQALFRIRGDIDRVIVGDTKLFNHTLKPIAEQLESLRIESKMSDAFRGEAMGSVMDKMVYGYSDYTRADAYSLSAYYEYIHSYQLPELYDFRQVEVLNTISDPLAGAIEPKDKELFKPVKFYSRDKRWLSMDTDPTPWVLLDESGAIQKINEHMPKGEWLPLEDLSRKLSRPLTRKKGVLKARDFYKALKKCIQLEIRDKDGKTQSNFSVNTAEVRLIKDCPFNKFEISGKYTSFYRYQRVIKPFMDSVEDLDLVV